MHKFLLITLLLSVLHAQTYEEFVNSQNKAFSPNMLNHISGNRPGKKIPPPPIFGQNCWVKIFLMIFSILDLAMDDLVRFGDRPDLPADNWPVSISKCQYFFR